MRSRENNMKTDMEQMKIKLPMDKMQFTVLFILSLCPYSSPSARIDRICCHFYWHSFHNHNQAFLALFDYFAPSSTIFSFIWQFLHLLWLQNKIIFMKISTKLLDGFDIKFVQNLHNIEIIQVKYTNIDYVYLYFMNKKMLWKRTAKK